MKQIKIFDQEANPFSLRFRNKRLEKSFFADYIEKYLWQIRMAMVLAIVLYTLAASSEILIFNLDPKVALIRLIWVDASFLIGLLLTYIQREFYKKHYKIFNIYYVLLTGLSFIHAGYIAESEYSFALYSGLFVCVFFNYTVIRQDFIKASLTGITLLISYMIVAFVLSEFQAEAYHITMYYIAFNILGMFIAYLIEYDNRKNFILLNRINEDKLLITKTNKALELRVHSRTLDLQKAKNRAEESDRLKSRFLANMSHEIRTPMNGILGFTKLLEKPNLSNEKQKQYFELIAQCGDRMLETVNNIIDISMLEEGLLKANIYRVDIINRLNSLIDFFTTEAENKGLSLLYNKSNMPEKLVIETDPGLFDSICSNLLKNAIKFTQEGQIEFGMLPEEEHIQFYVRDTGIGIPENRQKAIFERFIQADIEDKNVYEGSGLGLSIAKSNVELLGGKIWLDSSPGQGSTFYFTIPGKNPGKSGEELTKVSVEKVAPPGNKTDILIVDDDTASVKLLEGILAPHVNTIHTAHTGKEAVSVFQKNPEIKIILMDIKMPVMDGYEATRQIRELDSEVIIIAQTAFALKGDREKALSEGCNDYISKPTHVDSLLALLKKYTT